MSYKINIRYDQFLPIFFGELRTLSVQFATMLGCSTVDRSQLFLSFQREVGRLGDAIRPLPHHGRVLDYGPSDATQSLPMSEQEFRLEYNMVPSEEIHAVKDKVADCIIFFCLLTDKFP